jgi:hypothetical protein
MSTTPGGYTPTKWGPQKAIAGGVLGFILLVVQSLDLSAKHHPVTFLEWVINVAGAVVIAGGVWQTRNKATGNGGAV